MAYTVRGIFNGALVELSKVNAPSLLLEDFNYLINKAIQQVANKAYNIYDLNQQQTDTLRVLKATSLLKAEHVYNTNATYAALKDLGAGKAKLVDGTYEVILPDDYMHLLNCICVYKVKNNVECYNNGDHAEYAAKRLTADQWSTVVNDFYNRPTPQNPYYYIHNVNTNHTNELTPTNPYNPDNTPLGSKYGTDLAQPYPSEVENPNQGTLKGDSNLPRVVKLSDVFKGKTESSIVVKDTAQRYGNASKVRMEIRTGRDSSVYELEYVAIDYLKVPQHIRLTQEQVDLTMDTSQVMEFPDYVCNEIINELVHLVMAITADPSLQVHPTVTQSIASPVQQQTQQKS